MAAAYNGHEGVVEELLGQPSIRVNDTVQHDYTALHWAAMQGHQGVVRMLASHHDVNVNARNEWGETPLKEADKKGHQDCAHILRATLNKVQVGGHLYTA